MLSSCLCAVPCLSLTGVWWPVYMYSGRERMGSKVSAYRLQFDRRNMCTTLGYYAILFFSRSYDSGIACLIVDVISYVTRVFHSGVYRCVCRLSLVKNVHYAP